MNWYMAQESEDNLKCMGARASPGEHPCCQENVLLGAAQRAGKEAGTGLTQSWDL